MLVLDALFDHIQQISSNVEISKSVLLRTLVAASGAKTAAVGVSNFVTKLRTPIALKLLSDSTAAAE